MAPRRKSNRPGRIRQTVAARDALGSLARTLTGSTAGGQLGLSLAWAQVADARLRERVHPLRLERHRLILRAREASWAAEVMRNEAAILERLARVLGAGKVRSLEVQVGPDGA